MKEFVDTGFSSTELLNNDNNLNTGHDCLEGHANQALQDDDCSTPALFACMPKWKG